MFYVIRIQDHVARKTHLCEICGGEIPVGELYRKYVFAEDKVFYSVTNHIICFVEKESSNHMSLDGEQYGQQC